MTTFPDMENSRLSFRIEQKDSLPGELCKSETDILPHIPGSNLSHIFLSACDKVAHFFRDAAFVDAWLFRNSRERITDKKITAFVLVHPLLISRNQSMIQWAIHCIAIWLRAWCLNCRGNACLLSKCIRASLFLLQFDLNILMMSNLVRLAPSRVGLLRRQISEAKAEWILHGRKAKNVLSQNFNFSNKEKQKRDGLFPKGHMKIGRC